MLILAMHADIAEIRRETQSLLKSRLVSCCCCLLFWFCFIFPMLNLQQEEFRHKNLPLISSMVVSASHADTVAPNPAAKPN